MKEKLLKSMGFLIVLLDIAIYFIMSYVFVDSFQVNILAIAVNGTLLFVGAIVATTAMMKQGLLLGKDNEKYKETLQAHIKEKEKIFTKINKLQSWLDSDYLELLRIGRSVYVNSAGYAYEEVFNSDGKLNNAFSIKKPMKIGISHWYNAIFAPVNNLFYWLFSDEWKLYREKQVLIRKAKRYKVTKLMVSDLLNVNASRDPNNFGMTESQYTKKQSGMSIVSRLLFSVLLQSISFGFYGFNIATFLTQLLNVVLILLSAFFAMFNAYSFMVKTHRETIIKKINKLEEFDNVPNEILDKLNKLEERDNGNVCSEISVCTQSSMVEKVYK